MLGVSAADSRRFDGLLLTAIAELISTVWILEGALPCALRIPVEQAGDAGR
jgi:hypothetical protein